MAATAGRAGAGALDRAEVARYARHLLLPEVGQLGQRAAQGRPGARGRGRGAGVAGAALPRRRGGRARSAWSTTTWSRRPTCSARWSTASTTSAGSRPSRPPRRSRGVNPLVTVVRHDVRLDSANALEVLATTTSCWTAPTTSRPATWSTTPACCWASRTCGGRSTASTGRSSVWWAEHGPCYRCVFPEPPPPGRCPRAPRAGCSGVLCAAIGSVQATEARQAAAGIGEPLVGRLLVHDALRQTWDALTVRKDPGCAGLRRVADGHRGWWTTRCSAGSGAAAGVGAAVPTVDGAARAARAGSAGRGAAGRRPRSMLVDVRGPEERAIVGDPRRRGDAPGRVPRRRRRARGLPLDPPVVVNCKSGARSAEAARPAAGAGHTDARNLDGRRPGLGPRGRPDPAGLLTRGDATARPATSELADESSRWSTRSPRAWC